MGIKVIFGGKNYWKTQYKKHDWVVKTHWGDRLLSKNVERNRTAKSIIKELDALQKRTPVEFDITINQMPKKRLKKVM